MLWAVLLCLCFNDMIEHVWFVWLFGCLLMLSHQVQRAKKRNRVNMKIQIVRATTTTWCHQKETFGFHARQTMRMERGMNAQMKMLWAAGLMKPIQMMTQYAMQSSWKLQGHRKSAAASEGPSALPCGLDRSKRFHLSESWKKLVQISKQDGWDYTALPTVIGLGIHRHPSGMFWSGRFPGQPWYTSKWGSDKAEFDCLMAILRHLVKLYIKTAPVDAPAWGIHLEKLKSVQG